MSDQTLGDQITNVVLGITKKCMSLLKIGDEGKLQNFFNKQINNLNKDVKALKKNRETIADEKADQLEELKEKLEDAQVALDEAYTAIKVEDIATNNAAAAFADIYWEKIGVAEAVITKITNEIQSVTEKYDAKLQVIDADIALRQTRLEKLA